MFSLRNTKGFTLIEILVSLVILTTGFLGVIGLLAVTIDKNRLAGQITEATTLAQDKIESLRNASFITYDTTMPDSSNPLKADGSTGGAYTRTTFVDNHTGWDEIRVEVQWDRNGIKTVTLQTIISQ